MDTRTKIITAEEAQRLKENGAFVVSGYFDPLTFAHAERLKNFKRLCATVVVVISSAPDPILPSLARAQLAAGLECVDHVVEGPVPFTPNMRLEEEDEARLEQLILRVRARQQAAR